MAIYSEDEDPNVTQWNKENLRQFGYKKFKHGAKVLVAQCYLDDEVSEPHRSEMSETATVCSEPTDDEELVSIQYESGLIDFVPQDILEIL